MARQRGASRSSVDQSLWYRTPNRVLVIDEDLNKRLAPELTRRGRGARYILEFLPRGTLDPDVLRFIANNFQDAVLVTGDNDMARDHADVVRTTNATLAVVSPAAPQDPNEDAWEREIVHKWAHRLHEQPTGTVMLYRHHRVDRWRPRTR